MIPPFRTLAALVLVTAFSSTASGADDIAKKKASSQAAEASAKKWLAGLGKGGLVVKEKSGSAFKARYVAGVNSTSLDFRQDGWWVTVGISGKVTNDDKFDDLRKRLTFVALDQLPTPGLDVSGWVIHPRTPTSRIEKGIELVALKDGVLTLRVKTKCFALYGKDPEAMKRLPADAGAPKSAYFQIRESFPLDLTLTAPLEGLNAKDAPPKKQQR